MGLGLSKSEIEASVEMTSRQKNRQSQPSEDLGSDNIKGLNSSMRSLLRTHRLRYFVISHFPEADRSGVLENLVATNWPRDLLVKYERTDMFMESKIVAKLKRTILPISSEELLYARARGGVKSEVLGIFYDDEFANTIGLSIHDAVRTHYLVMLSGQRKVTDQAELARVLFAVMKSIDTLENHEAAVDLLSPQVLDSLRWSAAGKSSKDIAQIMDISTHTVNEYLKTAKERLNAVTRTQAVAIACRLRIL